MPQMAPLNWMSLMMFFIIIFMLFNMMNFYSFNYIPKQTSLKIKKSLINWKW